MKWLLLLLTFNVFAGPDHIDESCVPVETNFFSELTNKLLDWHGASDQKIMSAPCKNKQLPGREEMLNFINNKAKGKSSGTAHGVSFKNESPALIEAFRDFTTARDAFGWDKNPQNQKAIQKEFGINPACDKVLCAMEKIWGQEMALKMLYIKFKHSYNTSELAFNNSDRFKVNELDDVLLGLEDIPAHLAPLGKNNQRLTHFKRGFSLAQYNSSVAANAVIMLFDRWSKGTGPDRQYTIFHEMAHNVSTHLHDMDESPEWLKLSGWVKKGDNWSSSSSACHSSRYGQTNPAEDYAESLSAYRYNGREFKKRCPVKYEFLKRKVFRGIEYDDVKNCMQLSPAKASAIRSDLTESLMAKMGETEFTSEEIMRHCSGMFSNFPVPPEELTGCSLKLETSKSGDLLSSILKKHNVPDTANNRDMIMASLEEDQNSDEIFKKSEKLIQSIDDITRKSFEAANPEGFSYKDNTADNAHWSMTLQSCGSLYFEGKGQEATDCQLRKLIENDRQWQEWTGGKFGHYTPPEIFKKESLPALREKREEVLFEHLKKQNVVNEVKERQAKRFKEHLNYHQWVAKNKIAGLSDWKTMSPEEFCQATYSASTNFTESFGIPKGETIPRLHQRCVQEQSRESRRFEFKEKQWNRIMSDLYP